MKKITLSIITLLIASIGHAQLSQENLSPKQKIRLAKKEQKAAKKDAEYLRIMDEAMKLFQENKLEEAKKQYELAHERRPDNVYPLVMLDDIQIAMEAEKAEVAQIDESPLPPPTPETPEIEEETQEEKITVVNTEIESEAKEEIILPKDTEIKIEEEKKELEKKPEPSPVIVKIDEPESKEEKVEIVEERENGVYDSSFKEGNAEVRQVDIVIDGVRTRYREVKHPWGAVYYFVNEDSISKEEWKKILKDNGLD